MQLPNNSYLELKKITDRFYTNWKMPDIYIFVDLLKKYEIKLRKKDGKLHEVTFSIPKTKKNSIVLGFRYEKKDGSFSEDLFLFQEGKEIVQGYRGKLEKILPEYKGTHKKNPST